MQNIKVMAIVSFVYALVAACDTVDHDDVVKDLESAGHRSIEVAVRGLAQIDRDDETPLFTEDLSVTPPNAEGPPGHCCFVRCGGTGYYENLWWVQHNCNGVGWDWCNGHYGTSLINAEWWRC